MRDYLEDTDWIRQYHEGKMFGSETSTMSKNPNNPNVHQLKTIRENNQRTIKSLIPRFKKLPGVTYVWEVSSTKVCCNGLRVLFNNQEHLKAFINGAKKTKSGFYTLEGVEIFASMQTPLHSDIRKVNERYFVEMREHFSSDTQPPRWKRHATIEHFSDQKEDQENPPSKRAIAYAEQEIAKVFEYDEIAEEFDKQMGLEAPPVPKRVEYRIVKETTTLEVVGYKREKRPEKIVKPELPSSLPPLPSLPPGA